MIQRNKYATTVLLIGFLVSGCIAYAQTADTTPPTVPTGAAAVLASGGRVTVSWTASTDAVGVTGYNVYRNGNFVASVVGVSYNEAVSPGGYMYTVAAYDAAGNVSQQTLPTNSLFFVADTAPPSAPTWIALTPATSTVALSWNGAIDNVGITGYSIYRNGSLVSQPSGTSYTDSGLIPGWSFSYQVVAYDAAGNTSYSERVNVTTISDLTAPDVPSPPYLTVRSSSVIDLAWSPSSDNVGVAGYYIYRNGTKIATAVATTTYKDTGLSPSINYIYTVAAYDAVGNVSAQSYASQGTTLPPDTVPPSMPLGLTAKPVSTSEIDLSWWASSDNVGVVGYYLYRGGSQIANTSSTNFANTGLATSTNYSYTVVAYDAAGNISARTATTSISTLAANPATATGTPPPVSPPPVVATTTPAPATGGAGIFNFNLYSGLRNADVKTLQLFLIRKGYLGADYATGFFGALTGKAVQQFQCEQKIVCSGNSWTTGWGLVGKKTRAALNAL